MEDTKSQSQVVPPEDRVPVGEKIAYGVGTAHDMWGHWLYPGLANPVFVVFLGVQPWAANLALALIRFIDALSDPFFGWLSDNTRTRWGRRRPFIFVGAILAGVGLPLLFFVSPGWGSTHLNLGLNFTLNLGFWASKIDLTNVVVSNYFWWMLLSSAIYIPLVSMYNMPYRSLGPELTADYNERTSLMSYQGAIQKLFEVGFFLGLPFTNLAIFTIAGTGKQNVLLGVQVYCAILGTLMTLFGLTVFFRVKERMYTKITERKQERISLKESFYETLKCKPFRILLFAGLAFTTGTSMVGALGWYATVYYACGGDTVVGNNWNGVMGVSYMIGGFVGVSLIGWMGRRMDKRHAAMLAAAAGVAAYIATWWLYNPTYPWLQPFASGSIAFTTAGLWMLQSSMGADVMDFDELKTSKRREGAFSSCNSWIMKVGNSLGYLATGFMLQWIGFDSTRGAQSEQTLLGIRLTLAGFPIIGLGLALLMFWLYPLTRERMHETRLALEARRGKV